MHSFLERSGILPTIRLFRRAAGDFGSDGAGSMAAALAFHTTISLVPLLLIFINLAGLFYPDAIVDGQVVEQAQTYIGTEAAQLAEDVLKQNQSLLRSDEFSWTLFSTAIITGLTLFYFASGMFHQLKVSLNAIWGVRSTYVPTFRSGIIYFVIDRLFAGLMVLGVNVFLIFLILFSAILATSEVVLVAFWPGIQPYLPYLHIAVSPFFVVIPFALIYKYLPDASVVWRDVWIGAAVTSVLFALGTRLIGIYLNNARLVSLYGAVGAFIMVLLWIYWTAMVVLYGAEFTKVYANTHGDSITPSIPLERYIYGESRSGSSTETS